MRQKLTTAAEVAGMVLVSVAAGLVAVPFGMAVAGACMLAVGVIGGRE